jgi:hypothetical protein
MAVPILRPEHRWECPNCDQTAVTHEARPHTQMHSCPGLFMLTAPMVEAGTRADVRAVTRENYLGGAVQTTTEDGTPISSIVRIREDGQDCWAQAEAARIVVNY